MSLVQNSHNDWEKFLKERNWTHKDVDYYMNNILDTPEFNKKAGIVVKLKTNKYVVKDSKIHGKGVFAKIGINIGDILGLEIGLENGVKYRSCLGRFTNHSNEHNVVFSEIKKNHVVAECVRKIKKGEEVLVNYRNHFF